MTLFYDILRGASAIAILVILIGAIIACSRVLSVATLLQAGGAFGMAASTAMGYLITIGGDPKTGRLEPVWVWRLEHLLSSAGICIFAIGYLIERSSQNKALT